MQRRQELPLFRPSGRILARLGVVVSLAKVPDLCGVTRLAQTREKSPEPERLFQQAAGAVAECCAFWTNTSYSVLLCARAAPPTRAATSQPQPWILRQCCPERRLTYANADRPSQSATLPVCVCVGRQYGHQIPIARNGNQKPVSDSCSASPNNSSLTRAARRSEWPSRLMLWPRRPTISTKTPALGFERPVSFCHRGARCLLPR